MPVHERQAEYANTQEKTGLDGKSGARVEIPDPDAEGGHREAYEPQVALGDVFDPAWNEDPEPEEPE
jgi:hypothetical protein